MKTTFNTNVLKLVSKNQFRKIGIVLLTAVTLFSCTPNDEELKTNETTVVTNVAPIDGKSFSADEIQHPITFRWTPIIPKPKEVTYRLKVWQLMQGQSGTQAMRSNQPIVVKDVDNITATEISGIYNGPCRPPYLCDFVWIVQSIDANGVEISESTPTVFNF